MTRTTAPRDGPPSGNAGTRHDPAVPVRPVTGSGHRRVLVPWLPLVLVALLLALAGCTDSGSSPDGGDGGAGAGGGGGSGVTGGGGSTGGDSAGGSTASGTWSTETIAGMSVHLYVPQTEPAHPDGRALMVTLHGCVQEAADLQHGGNWTGTADDHGMVVAVPDAPGGGVLLGCWDYYGTDHSRTSPARHDDNVLDLVSTLTDRPGLDVDPDQVYLSGLSSGGTQAMVLGCLAPEVFAGIGMTAAPTVGTTSRQLSEVATSAERATATCRAFAGTAEPSFDTQLTSIVYDNNDQAVAPGYNELNAEVMAGLYGASGTSSLPLDGLDGSNTAGTGTLYSDAQGPRVSLIQNTGLGHRWPAGGGPGGTYISTDSIDYPAYVTGFFLQNNRRTSPLPAD